MKEEGESGVAYCPKCRTRRVFEYHVRYNFGDVNMGVAEDHWECVVCGFTKQVFS